MIRMLRDLRLLPVVLAASVALLSLKMLGLVLDGGYIFDSMPTGESTVPASIATTDSGDAGAPLADEDGAKPASAASGETAAALLKNPSQPVLKQPSWAKQMFEFPGGSWRRHRLRCGKQE